MKNKKNIILIGLLIAAVLILAAGIMYSNFSKNLDQGKLENLISASYDIKDFSSNDSTIKFTVRGDLSVEEAKDLNCKIYDTVKGEKLKQSYIDIIFEKSNSQEQNDFYYEGIIAKSKINLNSENYELQQFESVSGDKGTSLDDFSDEDIEGSTDDGTIKISLSADNENMDESEAMVQCKTYGAAFIKSNSDKQIKDFEIKLRISDKKAYIYRNSKSDVLGISETVKL